MATPRPPRKSGPGGRARPRTESPTQKGKVTHLEGNQVFIELSPKVHGVIAVEEFLEPPSAGQEFDFSLENINADGLWNLSRTAARIQETWGKLKEGALVEAKVIGENTGGLELKIGPVTAFMPTSQIAIGATDAKQFFGKTIECEILEVNRKRRRVVLSRKAIEFKQQREERRKAAEALAEGDVVTGKVERLEPFGAIVDIGNGLSGLLHVSNISYQHVKDPASVLNPGQEVQVKILELKKGGKRIALGMKQLETDPWDLVDAEFSVDSRHAGKVTRTADFGAFVQMSGGVEGLLHISQLSPQRVEQVSDAVQVGEEVQVRVLSVDRAKKRISLSRLNQKGALIGSEDDVDAAVEMDEPGESFDPLRAPPKERGTNLGDVLRRALEGH